MAARILFQFMGMSRLRFDFTGCSQFGSSVRGMLKLLNAVRKIGPRERIIACK